MFLFKKKKEAQIMLLWTNQGIQEHQAVLNLPLFQQGQ